MLEVLRNLGRGESTRPLPIESGKPAINRVKEEWIESTSTGYPLYEVDGSNLKSPKICHDYRTEDGTLIGTVYELGNDWRKSYRGYWRYNGDSIDEQFSAEEWNVERVGSVEVKLYRLIKYRIDPRTGGTVSEEAIEEETKVTRKD